VLSRPSDAGAAWTLRSQHLGGYLASAQLEVSETKGGEGQVPGLRARGTSERDDVKHPAIPWFIHAAAAGPGTSDAEEGVCIEGYCQVAGVFSVRTFGVQPSRCRNGGRELGAYAATVWGRRQGATMRSRASD